MSQRSDPIAVLDVGSSKIVVLIGREREDGGVEIIGVGKSPTAGVRRGVVIHLEEASRSVKEALQQAEKMAGVEVRQVHVAVAGAQLEGRDSSGTVAVKGREIKEADIARVMEVVQAIPIAADREVLHVLAQEFIVDGNDGVKEPLGMSAIRLEARAHIITGQGRISDNIIKCINRVGLAVADLVASPIAQACAALLPSEQEVGVALLDIGAGTSDLVVYHSGAVRLTKSFPFGGTLITNDLAQGLRMPLRAAEEAKCRYGVALRSIVGRNESGEVFVPDLVSPKVFSKVALAEIIEPRVREILQFVANEILEAGLQEKISSGVVVTGGLANLPGITQLAEQVFKSKIRLGAAPRPDLFSGLTDMVAGPEYMSPLGLLALSIIRGRGENYSGLGDKKSVGSSASKTGLLKRLGGLFAEYF
jgi:cell division protein FtsA